MNGSAKDWSVIAAAENLDGDDLDEFVEDNFQGDPTLFELALADAIYNTQLHYSAGRYGRYLEDVVSIHGWTPPGGGGYQ